MRISARRNSSQAERRGAALVEMALVFPVFLTVLLGMVEFGRALMVGQLITNAAREGARQAILDGSTNSAVESTIKTFLQSTTNVSSGDVTVSIALTSTSGATTLSTARTGDLVTVTCQIPFTKVSYLPPTFLTNKNLSGQAAMRHE